MSFKSPSNQYLQQPGGPEALVDAFASAYALVAYADSDLDRLESARYLEAAEAHHVLADVPHARLAARLNQIARDIFDGGEKGYASAVDKVAAVSNDADARDAVIAAARAAIVANREIKPVEEAALANLATALGIDAADI